MSPTELLDAAKLQVPSINLATIYRALNRLTEKGDIALVALPNEPPRYELAAAAEHHHHHFRCDQCERVYDIPGCVHSLDSLLPAGFQARAHEVVFYGTCQACSAKAGKPGRGSSRAKAGGR